jgi:uncharacterized membrane protein (UPF0127 family)
MNKIFSVLAVLLVLAAIFLEWQDSANIGKSLTFPNVKINKEIIKVSVADEINEQIQGLSDRLYLEKDEGLLFIFDKQQERSFWMKRMNFPIDIIWINDNRIVNIHKNLAPEGDNPQNHYNSQVAVNYVLEVNAGFVDDKKIKIGDIVEYNLLKN